jgi:CTP synthase
MKNANSEEFGAGEGDNVVYIMDGQQGKQSTGGTMRLGDYPAYLENGSLVSEIYGLTSASERHRHRYEVNQRFIQEIEKGGLVVSGKSPDGTLVEYVEAPARNYFIATQAHPEFKSRPFRPHLLFSGLIRAAKSET